jgi:hypothetical protein
MIIVHILDKSFLEVVFHQLLAVKIIIVKKIIHRFDNNKLSVN